MDQLEYIAEAVHRLANVGEHVAILWGFDRAKQACDPDAILEVTKHHGADCAICQVLRAKSKQLAATRK